MENLNQMIDHTLLKPTATKSDIRKLCQEARTHKFKTVCVNPCYIKESVANLEGSGVGVCTVIGFPLGATLRNVKSFEARLAVDAGATEIDMVINIGALKEGRLDYVRDDIASVVEASAGRIVKVILETSLLTDKEIIQGCKCAKEARAHFVKTSTGFADGGATLEAVRLMKETVGKELKVKASGGIRDRETALAMIEAGASRLGTSSSLKIMGADSSSENSGY